MQRQRTKNEVFTPYWCAKRMILQDKNTLDDIFLEPSVGDGNFLVVIAKIKLQQAYQHNTLTNSRLLSIFNSIYGIELHADNVKVARKRLCNLASSYSSKVSNITNNTKSNLNIIIKNNIIQGNTLTLKDSNNQLIYISRLAYNSSNDKIQKTAQHLKINKGDKDKILTPDFIIGNPPYNIRNHTKGNISYSQLFHRFVEYSVNLQPHYVSLIIPNRWFSGGKNLKRFRQLMLNDKHLESMSIWNNSKDVFPNVSINGGVSYFFWNKNCNNHNRIEVSRCKRKNVLSVQKRPLKLKNVKVFIKDNYGAKLLEKLCSIIGKDNLGKHCSSSCPFTLRPYYPKRSHNWLKKPTKNCIKCYARNNIVGYVKKNILKKRFLTHKSKQKYMPLIKKYKLITPCANGIGISKNDNIHTIIAEPNSICTETYIVIGNDLGLDKEELINLSKYLKTKFVRFLISLHKSSQHAVRKVYNFIPLQDFSNKSDIDWNKNIDKQLEKKYKLDKNTIKHINQVIHY